MPWAANVEIKYIHVKVRGQTEPSALFIPLLPGAMATILEQMDWLRVSRVGRRNLHSASFFYYGGVWMSGHWGPDGLIPKPFPLHDYWVLDYKIIDVIQVQITVAEYEVWWSGFCPKTNLRISTEHVLRSQVVGLITEEKDAESNTGRGHVSDCDDGGSHLVNSGNAAQLTKQGRPSTQLLPPPGDGHSGPEV